MQVCRTQDQAVRIGNVLPDGAAARFELLQAAGRNMFMVFMLYMVFHLKLFQIIDERIHARHRHRIVE